jgi:hypothetical protein
MKLPFVVTDINKVAEAHREFYVKKGEKWYLDLDGELEGYVAKEKLDEFRNNNIELMKKLEAAQSKRALTPEEEAEFTRLKSQEQQIKEKKLLDSGQIEEVVSQRVATLKGDYEGKITGLTKKVTELETGLHGMTNKYANTVITAEISKVIPTIGKLRPQAMDDVISRARSTWLYDSTADVVVAKNAKGEVIYGKDGKQPMTIAEWCAGLVETAPHFFEGSAGGGGEGSGSRQQGGTIKAGDNKAFIENLDKIAKGEITVQPSS